MAAADPAAQLMKLGEAEAVGTPDRHGVDPGQIEAAFDDVRGDDTEVLDPDQRRLQRARDRCRRQCEDMNLAPEPPQLLFLRGAEALLLVDHQKPEVLEPDASGGQSMGAHHDMETAAGDPFLHLALPDGRSMLIVLSHVADLDPQVLPGPARDGLAVRVHFERGPHVDARIAHDLTRST